MAAISRDLGEEQLSQRSLRGLHRVQDLLRQSRFRRPRRMNPAWIEVIGAAGSGKSTFIGQIRKGRRWPSFWATLPELPDLNRPPHSTKTGLDTRLLDLLEDKIHAARTERHDSHTEIRHVCIAFDRFLRAVTLESEDMPCHVVEEGGLFYNFRGQLTSGRALDPALLAYLARQRCLVYVRVEPRLIVENLRRRAEKGGKVLAAHREATDDALLAATTREVECLEKLVALFRQTGRPVLEIEPFGSVGANVAAFEGAFD